MAKIDSRRILSDASNFDTFQNLLPYKFKKQGRTYRAGRKGGVYLKENKHGILTANFPNGDYTSGNVLSIAAQVFNLDLKTGEGFKTACIEVCKAANLDFSKYCTNAPGDYKFNSTPSVLKPVETKVFLPNAGQLLEISYSIEYAKEDAPEYLAQAAATVIKTGIPTEKQKAFGFLPISSRVHLKSGRKEIFTSQNFAFAIVSSTLQHSIKIKNPTAKDKAFKVLFAQNSGNFLYGGEQLPPIDERKGKVLFIVEGEEKAACINYNLGQYGFYAITQGGIYNGAYCPFFDVLRGQFKSVITWYDFDSGKGAGQKAAQRLYDEHGLNYVKHELYANDCKDINDIFVKHGKAFLLDIARLEVARLTMVEAAKTAAENITIQANKGEYIANILPQNGIELTAEYLPIYYPSVPTPLVFNITDFTPTLIVSEKANASFVELVNSNLDACFYETSLKITRQIKNGNIILKNDFKTDITKKLYVLYDSNVKMLPEYFKGFKETIFVVNDEIKKTASMTEFILDTDSAVNNFLQMLDNRSYSTHFEKQFYELAKKKVLPVRKEGSMWVRCADTAMALETEQQCKILAVNHNKMKSYLDKFTPSVNTVKSVISESTSEIMTDIKATEIQLKKEKRDEFNEFFENIKGFEKFDFSTFDSIPYETLDRGAKVAYNRIKALLKLNVEFSTAIEAVKNSYQTWARTKGQFTTSKVMSNKTQNAKRLNTFKNEVENKLLSKDEIIDFAQKHIEYVISKNRKTAWNELKRMFLITSKKIQSKKVRNRLYELHFLECVQKSLLYSN